MTRDTFATYQAADAARQQLARHDAGRFGPIEVLARADGTYRLFVIDQRWQTNGDLGPAGVARRLAQPEG